MKCKMGQFSGGKMLNLAKMSVAFKTLSYLTELQELQYIHVHIYINTNIYKYVKK